MQNELKNEKQRYKESVEQINELSRRLRIFTTSGKALGMSSVSFLILFILILILIVILTVILIIILIITHA